jgi:hypothetical protein
MSDHQKRLTTDDEHRQNFCYVTNVVVVAAAERLRSQLPELRMGGPKSIGLKHSLEH